jgi:general secretion pathway protein F
MPIFEYKAYAPGGAIRTGVVDADTAREARARLRREDILVSEIQEMRGGRRGLKAKGLFGRIQRLRQQHATPTGSNVEVVAAATRQMGTLLGAGIPLTETLKAIIEQTEEKRAERMFREIRERVTQGTSLADALAEHPGWFNELYVNMVRAGQATGNLDIVFNRLADYLQKQRTLRRKVVSSLTYPAMMIVIGMIVVSILMTVVVPKITAMLIDSGQTLPGPTRILVAVSTGFKNYWWLGLLTIAAISFVIERIYKTDGGRLFIDKNLLRVPVIGDLLRKQAVARFTHTFSTLLQSGVPAVASLEITRSVVGNRVLADATAMIRMRILEGTDIRPALKDPEAFPPVVGYMVASASRRASSRRCSTASATPTTRRSTSRPSA